MSQREKAPVRLVVNADDLGMDPQIDQGILFAHREGIVTSASLLATGPTAGEAVRLANEVGLSLGVHLCLTSRLPPALSPDQVPSLAADGRFPRAWSEVVRARFGGQLRLQEVDREFRAQIERARRLGAQIDHLDSHQHLHLLPGIVEVVHQIACEEELPVRWPLESPRPSWLRTPGRSMKSLALSVLALACRDRRLRQVRAIGIRDAGGLDEGTLMDLLSSLEPGDHELGCHPGMGVEAVAAEPGWRYRWDEERHALCSPRAKELIRARQIVLITYAGLCGRSSRLPNASKGNREVPAPR